MQRSELCNSVSQFFQNCFTPFSFSLLWSFLWKLLRRLLTATNKSKTEPYKGGHSIEWNPLAVKSNQNLSTHLVFVYSHDSTWASLTRALCALKQKEALTLFRLWLLLKPAYGLPLLISFSNFLFSLFLLSVRAGVRIFSYLPLPLSVRVKVRVTFHAPSP